MFIAIIKIIVTQVSKIRLAEAESAHEHWLSSYLEGVNNEDQARMAKNLYTEVPLLIILYIYLIPFFFSI